MTGRIEVPEWRRLVDRAKHLISLKRPEEARHYAARAAAMAPGEARPLCVLAIATSDLGQHEVALEQAAQAIALEPELDWPHRVRGLVLIEMKRYKDAVAAGQTAVQLAPEEASGYNLLAGALRLAGRLDEAEAAAERLREQAPDWHVTYEVSADVAYERGRWREAERWAREGLRLEPSSGRLQVVLGRVLADLARFGEAADLAQQGVGNEPMDPWHRSSFDKILSQHANARFGALSLIVIFLLTSAFFGMEAVDKWQSHHAGSAVVFGSIALGAFSLSLVFMSWLPRRLPPSLRRLQHEQIRREFLGPFSRRRHKR